MPPFSSADPNAFVAVGIQSALASLQTTPAKFRFAKYLSGNRFDVTPAVVDVREGGDGLDYGFTYKRGIEVAGQIVCYPRPEFLGQALALVVGGATWNGASGPAQHSFHSNHASYPYATLQMAHPGTDLMHLFGDVRFLGFTLEAAAGMPHKLTLPFKAINIGASSGIALVPSYTPVEDPFLFHTAPSYAIDGTGDATIDSFTISMRLGTEDLQAQGIELDDIVVMNRDMDMTFTRRYQNATLWKKIAYAGGVEATTAVATGAFMGFNSYGAGAALSSLQINAGLLSYRQNQITDLDPDGKTVKEVITAKLLHTATSAISVILKNAHASAYGS